jgi:hypothetical protein
LAGSSRGVHLREELGLYLKHDAAITFRDDTMPRENSLVRRRWQHANAVEERYKAMGISFDTPQRRAAVHLDMGIRAQRFYPPWNYSAPQASIPFARRCFKHALRLDSQLQTALELQSLSDEILVALSDLPSPLGLPTQAELAAIQSLPFER